MKKANFAKMRGVDRILCGIAGVIMGFLVGGIVPAVLVGFVGVVAGHFLEKDLDKIKI